MHDQKPLKMAITNLVTTDTIRPQYNPEIVKEELSAVWTSLAVPGLSHPRKQFIHTEAYTINLTLMFNAIGKSPEQQAENLYARRFIMAAMTPRAGAGSVATGGAPRLLFVWPGMISITCNIAKASFEHRTFNWLGPSTVFTAEVSIEEVRSRLYTMEEVLSQGTERSSTSEEGR